MPRPMPVSYIEVERERLKVAMHWYWFHAFSMRAACSSGNFAWKLDSRPSQKRPSSAKAASTAPALAYLATISRPSFLFMTPGASYLGSSPCST